MKQRNSQFVPALVWLPPVLLPLGNCLSAILLPWTTAWLPWVASLVGAVAEELFFRGFLLKTILLRRCRPIPAVAAVSLLFAGFHLLNLTHSPWPVVLVQVFAALCFSLWAGAVTWQTNRITIPLLAHLLLNGTAVAESWVIGVVVSGIVLIDGCFLLFHRNRTSQRTGQHRTRTERSSL